MVHSGKPAGAVEDPQGRPRCKYHLAAPKPSENLQRSDSCHWKSLGAKNGDLGSRMFMQKAFFSGRLLYGIVSSHPRKFNTWDGHPRKPPAHTAPLELASIHRLSSSKGMNLGLQPAHTTSPRLSCRGLAHLLRPGQGRVSLVAKNEGPWCGHSL